MKPDSAARSLGVWHAIWHMPAGFATLIGALFVLVAAALAYVSVGKQIQSQTRLENAKLKQARQSLMVALYSEMMIYVPPLSKLLSEVNRVVDRKKARDGDDTSSRRVRMPELLTPTLFLANQSKMGDFGDSHTIMSALTFYLNLLNFIESVKKEPIGSFKAIEIAPVLQIMVLSLADSLTNLSGKPGLPLAADFDPKSYFSWDGHCLNDLTEKPQSIQDMLRLLGEAHQS